MASTILTVSRMTTGDALTGSSAHMTFAAVGKDRCWAGTYLVGRRKNFSVLFSSQKFLQNFSDFRHIESLDT